MCIRDRSSYKVTYDEGLEVGYKWYEAHNKPVLFPFGHGLSYTSFAYSGLQVTPGAKPEVRFLLKNTGKRAGAEVAEVYASLPTGTPLTANEPPQRLVGYSKVMLQPGESREVTVDIEPLYLAVYDEGSSTMRVAPGSYTFAVGGSSQGLTLKAQTTLAAAEVSR